MNLVLAEAVKNLNSVTVEEEHKFKEADLIWDFWESQTEEEQLYDMLKTEFNF